VEPETIVLILGSCVAVCIWDHRNAIGGATHYLLPTWDGRGLPSARYGSVAILALLQKLADAGANRDRLRAKIFGGGCLFGFTSELAGKKNDLGTRNVDVAVEVLSKEKIPLLSLEVGGDRGQRISFHTGTGDTTATRL
jgi:chemotaxis protein CheD